MAEPTRKVKLIVEAAKDVKVIAAEAVIIETRTDVALTGTETKIPREVPRVPKSAVANTALQTKVVAGVLSMKKNFCLVPTRTSRPKREQLGEAGLPNQVRNAWKSRLPQGVATRGSWRTLSFQRATIGQ